MKVVHILTQEQKDLIHEKEFAPDSHFNVMEDVDGNYFIGLEELYQNTKTEYEWLYLLPLIDHNPKLNPPITINGD